KKNSHADEFFIYCVGVLLMSIPGCGLRASGFALLKEVVYSQQDNSSNHSADKSNAVGTAIKTQSRPEIFGDERPGNSEQRRDDEAARVFSGHNQLGDRPRDKANNKSPKKLHSFVMLSALACLPAWQPHS